LKIDKPAAVPSSSITTKFTVKSKVVTMIRKVMVLAIACPNANWGRVDCGVWMSVRRGRAAAGSLRRAAAAFVSGRRRRRSVGSIFGASKPRRRR
jgi:hypothetical protein